MFLEKIPAKILDHIRHNGAAEGGYYLYDTAEIEANCRNFLSIPYAGKSIHFATMANIHPGFLRIIRDAGIKVFVNSMPHLEAVRKAGYAGGEIIYTASAMDEKAMRTAAAAGIIVNLDSLAQVREWESISAGKPFGIRCNIGKWVRPRKTRAGYFIGRDSRLGLDIGEIESLAGHGLVAGLHLYVGTDILDVDYFIDCYRKLLRLAGLFPKLEYLDFGGGFGIEDNDLTKEFNIKDYGAKVTRLMEDFSAKTGRPIRLILEPGRILGGKAGYFVCRAIDVKTRNGAQLVGVNASSVQFPRPLFYPETAFHPVARVPGKGPESGARTLRTRVYGCSTYSRDFLARDVRLPVIAPGDTLVFGHAGSYCASSYTEFLGFPRPPELFI